MESDICSLLATIHESHINGITVFAMCDCAALCVLVASLHQINRMPVVCFTMSALPPLPLFESDSDAATLQMFESDSDAATPSWVTWSPVTEYCSITPPTIPICDNDAISCGFAPNRICNWGCGSSSLRQPATTCATHNAHSRLRGILDSDHFMDSELFYNEVNADIDRQDMLRGLDAFIHHLRRPDPKIRSFYCRCRGLRYVQPPLYVRRRRTRRIASHTITKFLLQAASDTQMMGW